MLIDWFTVAAQLVNFLILVWLLRRFLYIPVLKALEERERKIAAELEHAATAEQEADRRRKEWERKNAEIDHNREQLLREAENEAQKTRNMLLEESRKAGDELRAKLEESLRREREEIASDTARRIEEEVLAVAGKVLDELADASIEDRMVERFCNRLMAADEEMLRVMGAPFEAKGLQAVVRSRFTLDEGQRTRIGEAVRSRFPTALPLVFETSEEQGATGIELGMNGHSISWTVGTALDELRSLSALSDSSSGNDKFGPDHGKQPEKRR